MVSDESKTNMAAGINRNRDERYIITKTVFVLRWK
jgi:hypothetical protein